MKIINPDGTVTYPFGEPVAPEKEIEALKKENKKLAKEKKELEGRVDVMEVALFEFIAETM